MSLCVIAMASVRTKVLFQSMVARWELVQFCVHTPTVGAWTRCTHTIPHITHIRVHPHTHTQVYFGGHYFLGLTKKFEKYPVH